MRILLMMAPTGERQHSVHAGANYPLALAQLAAQLGDRHEVSGYDPDMDPEYPASFGGLLREFEPELVGIGFRIFDTTLSYEPKSYLPELERALDRIKQVVPQALVALGGSAFSFFPEHLMRRLSQVDAGFYLDADVSFPAFAEEPEHVGEIPGIYFRQDGELVFTGPPQTMPMDELAMPAFDLFPPQPYIQEGRAAIGLESKRGCKLKCVPCVYPFLTGKEILSKSPGRILAEMEELVRRDVPRFFFLDSIFNIPQSHAVEVCEALSKAKLPIHWGAFLTANKFDDATCSLFFAAGCRLFYFAPDGISERAIKTWNRPITKEIQKQAIRRVRRHPDAHLHVSFLLGSPGETLRDLAEFAGFLAFLAWQRVFSVSMSFTRIYPQTKLWEIAVAEGVISRDDDLLEPKFYCRFPASLARFIFHPAYRFVHWAMRVKKRLSGWRENA